MSREDLAVLVRGIAPVVRKVVGDALGEVAGLVGALAARVHTLEARGPARDGIDGLAGKDGAPGPRGEHGAAGPQGERGAEGAPGPAGKDGAPGPAGERGADGRDGRDGAPGLAGKDGVEGVRGERGADGLDGLGIEDLQIEYDGERTITLAFSRGERRVERVIAMPVVLYRGVWIENKAYEQGDAVTWGGALWIARSATSARPGVAAPESRAWTLACKAGRDGKAGKDGATGLPGRDGRDLVRS